MPMILCHGTSGSRLRNSGGSSLAASENDLDGSLDRADEHEVAEDRLEGQPFRVGKNAVDVLQNMLELDAGVLGGSHQKTRMALFSMKGR